MHVHYVYISTLVVKTLVVKTLVVKTLVHSKDDVHVHSQTASSRNTEEHAQRHLKVDAHVHSQTARLTPQQTNKKNKIK